MSGGKDGQALFHRILLATATGGRGEVTSTIAVDWHYGQHAKNQLDP